jgi:hypothetical protein
MAPRHNPRRNVGAPVRFEDDETYLIERQRDSTKPAWPKLLAKSTVPYDHTLSPVNWNTRPLNQPFDQIPKRPPIKSQEAATHDTRNTEDFGKQIAFENPDDLEMATSESDGEDGDDDDDYTESDQTMVSIVPAWSALEPALQLSMYEYVCYFLEGQKEKEFVGIRKKNIMRAKAAEMLGLSSHEFSDIERQRAFRAANPLSEKYLQEQWWKEEETTMKGEDTLSKDASQYRKRWQAINARYVAFMVHICKYTFANERAIKLAKVYLKARGLKPKVIGEWTEGEEETTMALVSTQAADPKSPILLPISRYSVVSRETEPMPDVAVPALNAISQPPQKATIDVDQRKSSLRPDIPSDEIKSVEEFARRHDPKLSRPISAHEHQRGGSLVRPSDIHLKVNSSGTAEIRKKRSKRPADSELRSSYPNEYVGGERIVVLENGSVGFDVDAELTTEVEGLLLAGFEASRRGNTSALTSRMQESAISQSQSSAPKVLPRCFSDVLLELDSDHMSATRPSGIATKDQDRQPYLFTSTPPQPDWSPIGSLVGPICPSPGPVKSMSRIPKEEVAKLTSMVPALTPLRSVETQQKLQSHYTRAKKQARKQFSVQDIATLQENQASAADSRYERSISVPLLAPEHVNDDHDSGIRTSRAISNEPNVANRVSGIPLKTLKAPKTPKPKHPQQIGSHKVIRHQSTRKLGKGSRGGPGSYKKKQKMNQELGLVASPLVEKTNVGLSGDTSHAA